MKALILVPAIALAACNHTQPGVVVRTVEVPTAMPCVPLSDIPPEPPTVGDRLTGDANEDLAIVAESALQLRLWGKGMHAALTACAGDE